MINKTGPGPTSASAYGVSMDTTDSTLSYVDIDNMSVSITLQSTSHLLILFSVNAYGSEPGQQILIQALVGTNTALPGSVYLNTGATGLNEGAYCYNFYKPSVSAGTNTVKIQWKVTGGTGYAKTRTLTVLALSA